MHVTSSRSDRRWRGRRPPLAAVLMMAIAGIAGVANAVEFDEKLNAPTMKSAADFQGRVQTFAKAYREIREATPAQTVLNASLARQQFDLDWQLERAVNEGRPLDGLESVGVVSRGDGSYTVDLNEYPEWQIKADQLSQTFSSNLRDPVCETLLTRGFRPEDIAALKSYLASQDPAVAAKSATLPIALNFGRVVRKFDKIGRPVPNALVVSYWYQASRATNESNRVWTEGLLKSLDSQRVRILFSYFSEVQSSRFMSPESTSEGIGATLASVRSPDFEQKLIAASKGEAP